MKHILIVIFAIIFNGCMPKDLPTQSSINDQKITVKLSHMTTKTELEKISSELQAQNIIMDFSRSKFFDDGKLKTLSLHVAGEGGVPSGTSSADLMAIQFHYYGFELNSDGYFKIGVMD
jgi:hypothetical protein